MHGNDNQDNIGNSRNIFGMKVINALVFFEKGGSLRARFTFELSSDDNIYHDDNYNDNNNNRDTNLKYNNKITTLHIQFIK